MQCTFYTVHGAGLLPKELWINLADRFDSYYENGGREIQQNLDLGHFGWHCWKTAAGNGDDDRKRVDNDLNQNVARRRYLNCDLDSDANSTRCLIHSQQRIESHLFDRVTMEWMWLTAKDGGTACELKGDGKIRREAFFRVKFVLTIFREHFLEQMVYRKDDDDGSSITSSSEKAIYADLFAECLSEYNAISLLNDFELIRQHRLGSEELRDCKVSGPLSVCCGDLMRDCREAKDENVRKLTMSDDRVEFKQFIDSLDTKQRALVAITSKIHMFINHSIDEGREADDDREWQQRKRRNARNSDKYAVNKFVTEMDYSKHTKSPRLDDVPSILSRGTLSRLETILLLKYLESEDMDSDAVEEDLRNVFTNDATIVDSNLFRFFRKDRVTAKNVVLHLNKVEPFRFGCIMFFYWKIFEKHPSYATPKYNNLKEECLQNTIYSMSRSMFVSILEMARILWRTQNGRSLKASDVGVWNQNNEVPPHSPMSISHIFVLLMYCNFTNLQYHYKKIGCREMTDIQSHHDPEYCALKERNREIGWWYRLLVVSIAYWGERASVNDVFYTGMNCKMVFDDMGTKWICPTSTTESFIVALNFATEKGVILKLSESRDKYFDCEWLSEYPDERERLFMCANQIQIQDIRTYDFEQRLWITHSQYIQCLSLFSKLFHGNFVSELFKTAGNVMETQRMLLSIIHRFESNTLMPNGVALSVYDVQLCNALLKGSAGDGGIYFVIKSQLELFSVDLQRKLVLFDDDDNMVLSPFLQSVGRSLKNTMLMRDYIWKLNEKNVNKLKALNPGHWIHSDRWYSYRQSNGTTITFRLWFTRRIPGSDSAAFGFEFQKLPTVPISTVWSCWSAYVEELNWQFRCLFFMPYAEGNKVEESSFSADLFDDITSLTIHFALCIKRE